MQRGPTTYWKNGSLFLDLQLVPESLLRIFRKEKRYQQLTLFHLHLNILLFIYSPIVSSCITTYKKTPPPVPPRTTTKPFISITAQSSTESAQDAYMDGHGQRGDIISQSGLSNSTESLDSMKALTAAIEAANAQIHGPASQHMGNNTTTVTTTTTIATVSADDRKRDHFKKNRCLSIGIQV